MATNDLHDRVESARIAHETTLDFIERYSAFDESKHPRGKPENAGEFTSSQSAGSGSVEKPAWFKGKSKQPQANGGTPLPPVPGKSATAAEKPKKATHQFSPEELENLKKQWSGTLSKTNTPEQQATADALAKQAKMTPAEMSEKNAEWNNKNNPTWGSDGSEAKKVMVPDQPLPAGKYAEGDPRNDPKYEAYTNEIDKKIDQYLKDGKDTESQFSRVGESGTRVYSPERHEKQMELLKGYIDQFAHVPAEHKAWLIGGPSGAGKSTFLKKQGAEMGLKMGEKGPENAAVVNPDDVKDHMAKHGMIPDYPGLKPAETAALVHEESSYLSKIIQHELLKTGKNVVFDLTVSGKPEKFIDKYVKPTEAAGYGKIKAAFVDGDIPTSLYRAGKRHQQPDKEGIATMNGRYVPYSVVAAQSPSPGSKYKSQNRETFEAAAAKDAFASTLLYDNKTGQITRR